MKKTKLVYTSCSNDQFISFTTRSLHVKKHGGAVILQFRNPQRQRERRKTKGLMSGTMAVHVCYNFWYFPLSSSAKQQFVGKNQA